VAAWADIWCIVFDIDFRNQGLRPATNWSAFQSRVRYFVRHWVKWAMRVTMKRDFVLGKSMYH
jgi:hypothetical protein